MTVNDLIQKLLLISIISYRLKIFCLCAGLFFVSTHFIMLFFYKPEGTKRNKLDFYSALYVYPFFHQTWRLFSPPPDSNFKLYAHFEKSGIHKIDLFSEILQDHRSNRLKGLEPLLLAFVNSIHYFEKNTRYKDPVNGPVKNDLYFTMLEHSSRQYLKHKYKFEGGPLRLILVVENISNGEKKVFFNSVN